ncbi:N-succinyl-L,L-diaminopimelate desuccinylase [Liberibacter crescens BT-1]|uniref:Succinyl-diaminopimelate desuccinylase n=2 Tax=Liberibacter crescens TaxID=1273132 RepID=L0ET87_LIBCB|nr:N-succinyl-L,L-diaminopimelate desuccinylase [Liberibacter crescens BT-1]
MDPLDNLIKLIRCPSITPSEGGALSVLSNILEPLGFSITRITESESGIPDVENLYARLGTQSPHLMFAGHTDVVPTGDEKEWKHPPFSATIENNKIYGRGAVDMKGAIACFAAAIARFIKTNGHPKGSISFLITGDEEGLAINGTSKLLAWAAKKGETWDACIVGEPTSNYKLGDTIKIGRRGSLSGFITIHGVQGHVAYQHLSDNPIHSILPILDSLIYPSFDTGNSNFLPTNLEITTIDVGNPALNVIPGKAHAAFNVRFNNLWTVSTLMKEIDTRINQAAQNMLIKRNNTPINYTLKFNTSPSEAFLTYNNTLIPILKKTIENITGINPELSTSGGTSDSRFIKDYCPVIEFGLVGKTMHMINEHADLFDLEILTKIYENFIKNWFNCFSKRS